MRAADIVRRIWGDTPLANAANSANATPATLPVLSAAPLANAANSANAGRYSQDSQHSQPPMNGNAVQPFAGFAGGGAGNCCPPTQAAPPSPCATMPMRLGTSAAPQPRPSVWPPCTAARPRPTPPPPKGCCRPKASPHGLPNSTPKGESMNDDVQTVYARLRRAGLALRVNHGALHVSPRNRVTPELRALIVQHRQALIAHLQNRSRAGNDGNPYLQRLAEMQAEAAAITLIDRIRAEVRDLPF